MSTIKAPTLGRRVTQPPELALAPSTLGQATALTKPEPIAEGRTTRRSAKKVSVHILTKLPKAWMVNQQYHMPTCLLIFCLSMLQEASAPLRSTTPSTVINSPPTVTPGMTPSAPRKTARKAAKIDYVEVSYNPCHSREWYHLQLVD